jgi:hypothetical protein
MKIFSRHKSLLLFLVVATVLTVILLRTFIVGPFLARAITGYLDKEYGLYTTANSYGGDLFSNFIFKNVAISRGNPDDPQLHIAIDTVRARYFLPALVRGLDPFLDTLAISVKGAEIGINSRTRKKSAKAPFRLEDYLPASLPRLQIEDSALTVEGDDFSFISAQVAINIRPPEAGSQPVLVTLADIEAKIADSDLPLSTLKVKLAYSPQTLAFGKIIVNGTPVAGRAKVDFNTADNRIQVSGRFDQTPAHLNFTGRGGTDILALQLNLEKWVLPAKLLKATAPSLPPMAGILSGTIKVGTAPDSPLQSMDGLVSLAVERGRLGTISFAGNLEGRVADTVFSIQDLDLETGGNRIKLSGGSLPLSALGRGVLPIVHKTAIEQFVLEASDIPALQRLIQPDSAKPLAGQTMPRHLLTIGGALRGGQLLVSIAKLEMADSSITATSAKLTVPTRATSLETMTCTADLSLDIAELDKIGGLTQLPSLRGQATGSVKVSGTVGDPQGDFSLTGANFSYQNSPAATVVAVGRIDRQDLLIKSLDVKLGQDKMHLAGQMSLADLQVLEFSGAATITDIAAYHAYLNLPDSISGTVSLKANKPAHGNLTLKGTADKGTLGPTPYDHMTLVVKEQQKNNYQIQLSATSPLGRGRLAGELAIGPDTTTLALRELSLVRHDRPLDLAQPATITMDHQGRVGIDDLTLRGKTETISIHGTIGTKAENDLVITATGLESTGWLTTQYVLTGGTLHVAVTGTALAPRIMATGTAAAVQGPQLDPPFSGSFDFAIADSGIDIKKFAWQNINNQRISAKGSLPYDLFHQRILATPLDLEAALTLPKTSLPIGDSAEEKQATGNLVAQLKLSGTIANPQGMFSAEIAEMVLPFLPEPLTRELVSARCDISLAKEQLTIKTLRLEGNDFTLTGAGNWTGFADLGDLVSGFDNHALPGDLDMHLTVKSADIGWLAAKQKEIRRIKGHVEATLIAQGPAANPAISGTVTVNSGELRLRSMVPAMESLSAQLVLDGHMVQMKKFTGQMGGAPFSISGTLIRDQSDVLVDATLEGQNVLFFRDETMKVRGDTLLTMKGPLAKMRLAGDIWLTDCRYSRNVDFLGLFHESARPKKVMDSIFTLADPPWRDMQFHVRVHSRQPFLLQNNLVKGSFRPELLLIGTGELPVLSGEVYMDRTKISVPAGKVIINGGIIRFSEQEPDLPSFNLTAQSKLAGYDISMQIQGTADEPIITLSSIPPLSEEDLLLLVLTGTPPKSTSSKRQTSAAGMNMAVYLSRGVLEKWFSGDSAASDESILDRLEVNIGRQITKAGENTIEAEFRLADGVLYPNDQLMLTSEKDVYGNINAGIKTIFRFK